MAVSGLPVMARRRPSVHHLAISRGSGGDPRDRRPLARARDGPGYGMVEILDSMGQHYVALIKRVKSLF